MDEQWDIDRDGVMGNDTGMRSHRHELGILTALVALLLVPISAPSAAAMPEQPATSTVETGSPVAAAIDVEAPSAAALRTSGILAAIVAVAGVVGGVWWYLVVRRRHD